MGKGKSVDAVVEQVLNGGTFRVYLPSRNTYTTVVLCGIQCPSMGRRVAVPTDGPVVEGEAGATPATASAAAIASSSPSEPFAREAKFSSEFRALNRWGEAVAGRCGARWQVGVGQ